jgi:hypothetical protein
VLPGSNYGESIVNAIESARAVVLIFSSAANLSPAVQREMERAMHFAKPIIPFRLEDVPINKGMEFYLASCHWLDAISPPVERHIGQLASAVHALLGNEWSRSVAPAAPIKRGRRRLIVSATIVAALIAITAVAFFFATRRHAQVDDRTPSRKSTAPVLTGLSLDVQVRNPGEEPIREAFDGSLTALTRVRYEFSRDEKLVRVKAVCAYLQQLAQKDSVLPLWPASETGGPHFQTIPVVFVLQLLNDTAKALSVHRVELQVSESEADDRPLPVFVLAPDGLKIVNDGWAPLESATVQITSPENARGKVSLAKLEDSRLVTWSEINKTANAGAAARELKGTLEYFWFAKDGVRYSATSRFEAKPDQENSPATPVNAPGTEDPPTRLDLEVDKTGYQVTGPLARQIAPGEHDTVEVSVSAPRSSHHRFHLLVHYNDGQEGVLRSPEIDLEFFAARAARP